jgi:hypothetical protein
MVSLRRERASPDGFFDKRSLLSTSHSAQAGPPGRTYWNVSHVNLSSIDLLHKEGYLLPKNHTRRLTNLPLSPICNPLFRSYLIILHYIP